MLAIPNRRFKYLVSPLGDALIGTFAGVVGFLIYDNKKDKLERPSNITLYEILKNKYGDRISEITQRFKINKPATDSDKELEKEFLEFVKESK